MGSYGVLGGGGVLRSLGSYSGVALAPSPPPQLPLESVRLGPPPLLSPSPEVELDTEAVRERDRRVMADVGTAGQGGRGQRGEEATPPLG